MGTTLSLLALPTSKASPFIPSGYRERSPTDYVNDSFACDFIQEGGPGHGACSIVVCKVRSVYPVNANRAGINNFNSRPCQCLPLAVNTLALGKICI